MKNLKDIVNINEGQKDFDENDIIDALRTDKNKNAPLFKFPDGKIYSLKFDSYGPHYRTVYVFKEEKL